MRTINKPVMSRIPNDAELYEEVGLSKSHTSHNKTDEHSLIYSELDLHKGAEFKKQHDQTIYSTITQQNKKPKEFL